METSETAGSAGAAEELPEELMLAFAPVHKRALGTAVGTITGLLVFLATAFYVIVGPEPGFQLGLLGEYFRGYTVSWKGAFIGGAWGFLTGFVAGWFLAFCRNLVIATSIFVTRTKQELRATRDFLDHI